MDILTLIESDGFTFTRTASVNGGEWSGACPKCGGGPDPDRFKIWPDKGRFWCRRCGWSGDSIQYLRDYRGMAFKQACEYLNIDPKIRVVEPKTNKPKFVPKTIDPPCEIWQSKAAAFLKYAQDQLSKNSSVLDWLYDKRGLTDETIKEAGLGWNPEAIYREREVWGLPAEINERTGRPKKIWIPKGLVVPGWDNEQLQRLRIRRPDEDVKSKNDNRYVNVSGSSTVKPVFLQGDNDIHIIVESELDAILTAQEIESLICVVALGNAQTKPDESLHKILQPSELILIALDSDDAGAKPFWDFWTKIYSQVKRWPCIGGKDPCEMFKNGKSVRDWVYAGIGIDRLKAIIGEKEDQPDGVAIPIDDKTIKPKQPEHLKCLGVQCRYISRRQSDRFLFCGYENRPVIDMAACPEGDWVKDENGLPVK